MTKRAVYTALCGDRDTPHPVLKKSPNWRYIFFTDNKDLKSVEGWDEVRYLDKEENPILAAKRPKVLVHKYLPDYRETIWVDASYQIISPPESFLGGYFDSELAVSIHPSRKDIYDEAAKILTYGLDSRERVFATVNRYLQQGFIGKHKNSIYQLGIIYRKNKQSVRDMCEEWFNEIETGSLRDQLSFPYVISKHPEIVFGRFTDFAARGLARWLPHNKKMNNIFFIQPYGFNLKIGDRLNYEIGLMPDDAWVVIMDQDCCALVDKLGDLLNNVINRYPDTDLFSCYTNRLGLKYQRLPNVDMDNYDMLYHHTIANDRLQEHYSTCTDIDKPVAGFFMMFPKKTWESFPFQSEIIDMNKELNGKKGVYFDYDFSYRILKNNGKIRLIEGLYMLHAYRLGKHVKDVDHLTKIV